MPQDDSNTDQPAASGEETRQQTQNQPDLNEGCENGKQTEGGCAKSGEQRLKDKEREEEGGLEAGGGQPEAKKGADSGEGKEGKGIATDSSEHDKEEKAATLIQKNYRGYRTRRSMKGLNLNSNDRWHEALVGNKLHQTSKEAAEEGRNDGRSRWKRGGFYAGRLAGGSDKKSDEEGEEGVKGERKVNKQMEARYWLEIVDLKHRYGSNLKYYHAEWNKADTSENFFQWLDNGGGKDLDLKECPRERLESEKITFLNADQRKNYLVLIDDKGRLRWNKTGKLVDTSPGRHKDLGNGEGIVEMGEEEREEKRRLGQLTTASSSSSSLSSSDDGHHEPARYGRQKGEESKFKYWLSPRAVMDTLLRRATKQNTWIYVADMNYNLFIGIKQTGKFQHSSFLFGSRVTSAGLIRVKDGQLQSLNPLSGHYRAGTEHFKSFYKKLESEGVDMSAVSISKSLFIIGAIEKYGKLNKKKKDMKDKVKSVVKPGSLKKDGKGELIDEEEQRSRQIEQSARDSAKADKEGGVKKGEPKENGHAVLPAEGKDKEDMNDEERVQRAVGLVQRAMDKGVVDNEGGSGDKGGTEGKGEGHGNGGGESLAKQVAEKGQEMRDEMKEEGKQIDL